MIQEPTEVNWDTCRPPRDLKLISVWRFLCAGILVFLGSSVLSSLGVLDSVPGILVCFCQRLVPVQSCHVPSMGLVSCLSSGAFCFAWEEKDFCWHT